MINWRVTAYLEISSVIYRYNRFNCILSDCVTDNYRYIILAIFKYRYKALADTIAFTELEDWALPLRSFDYFNEPYTTAIVKKNWHAKYL